MAYSPPLEPSNLFSIAEERNGDRMEEIQLEMRPMGKVEMDGGGRTEKMYSGRLSSIGNNHGPPCPTERTHLRKSSSPDTSLIENSGEVRQSSFYISIAINSIHSVEIPFTVS